jgi:hypothetical protein
VRQEWLKPISSGHKNGRAGFDGMIRWRPTPKTVTLSQEEPDNKLREITFEFGPGDDDTHTICLRELKGFLLTSENGIDRQGQFECVESWHRDLWADAVHVWGLPKTKHNRLIALKAA